MKKVKVQDAVGLTLCHDITAMRDGFKGAAFKRGHVIEEGDVEKLLDLGKRTVFIWEENAGEIHEEDAARRMAAMAQVEGCHYTEPSEGKVLLMADTRGMFRVDTALLNQVNSIGDLTISTLPDHFPVEAGDRLASGDRGRAPLSGKKAARSAALPCAQGGRHHYRLRNLHGPDQR